MTSHHSQLYTLASGLTIAVDHWGAAGDGDSHGGPARQVRDGDLMAQVLADVRVPMLLVRGRMSDLVTEDGARDFLAEYPHAQFVDVSGAGHMVAGDRNAVFTAAVVDFCTSLLSADARP